MAKSNKVLKKNIPTGLGTSTDGSVDHNMLEMLKGLDLPNSKLGFGDTIEGYSLNMLNALKHARKYLENGDNKSLEEAALEISQNALRVGAINILKSSYELQSVARYKDFTEAETIVESLELEYLKVRQDLESVI